MKKVKDVLDRCSDAPSLSKNHKKQQKRQKNLRCHTQIRHPKAGTVMENLVRAEIEEWTSMLQGGMT
jgi:hypothetical protein